MRTRSHALVLLHLTVFIWGWTGILGKLITLPTGQLVVMRILIALAGLAAMAWWSRRSLSPATPDMAQYAFTSVLIMAHWITFYGAIKISTASIAAACLSTSTVFTAFMEPFWFKRRIRAYEVVLGIVVMAALGLIFGLEVEYREGIIVATVSALLSAWFNTVNGVLVKRGDAVRIGFYELLWTGAFTYIVLLAGQAFAPPSWKAAFDFSLPPPLWTQPWDQVVHHLALGLVCTAFAFTAGIAVMRQLSPFTVMLTVNLEPVYTIVIALLIWGERERLTTGSYIGIALILLCLFLNSWWLRRTEGAGT
jgi:drug/metabolite transporter (DMT)-like permease